MDAVRSREAGTGACHLELAGLAWGRFDCRDGPRLCLSLEKRCSMKLSGLVPGQPRDVAIEAHFSAMSRIPLTVNSLTRPFVYRTSYSVSGRDEPSRALHSMWQVGWGTLLGRNSCLSFRQQHS